MMIIDCLKSFLLSLVLTNLQGTLSSLVTAPCFCCRNLITGLTEMLEEVPATSKQDSYIECFKVRHPLNSYAVGTVYICIFKQISDQINSTQIANMFCGRYLVNLIIAF